MKTISISVTDEAYEVYIRNEEKLRETLKSLVETELRPELFERMENVKVIYRAKAPVCNWHDMEIQILKGSL